MMISVPYECPTLEIMVFNSCTVWHHVYYDYLTVTSSIQLPVAFNCRQLLKVRADRRKNGHLRKYHYSKIQNAGDCVARTGVREIGFKFGSLPHGPGGITCMHCLSRHFCCCPLVFEILEHLPYTFLNHEFCSLHAGQFFMLFVVFDFFSKHFLGEISSECQTV